MNRAANELSAYEIYLSSPRWRQLRDKVFTRDRYRCVSCRRRRKQVTQLHCHHKHYRNFMREQLDDLITLCHDCHRQEHQIHRLNKREIHWKELQELRDDERRRAVLAEEDQILVLMGVEEHVASLRVY